MAADALLSGYDLLESADRLVLESLPAHHDTAPRVIEHVLHVTSAPVATDLAGRLRLAGCSVRLQPPAQVSGPWAVVARHRSELAPGSVVRFLRFFREQEQPGHVSHIRWGAVAH